MATDPLAHVRNAGRRCALPRSATPARAFPRSTFTPGWTRSASLPPSTASPRSKASPAASAQLALLPGHRVAMQSCLEHVDEALDSHSTHDCTAILAALAVRLH